MPHLEPITILEHAQLVGISVLPMSDPLRLLPVLVRQTRTVARRSASFVLVLVPVLPTAVQSLIACVQPTPMPHLAPMTILEYAQLVPVLELNAPVLLAVLPQLLACAQPTTMEPLTILPRVYRVRMGVPLLQRGKH